MEDNGKYLRLFASLFFTFIGFIVAIIVLLLGLKFFFGMLSYIPGVVNIFTLFIICVPAALFISVYIIFFRRTSSHPSAPARIISYIFFTIALAAWGFFFVKDLILFFRYFYTTVGEYMSYDMIFLSGNVFVIFLVGIIQALTAKKEVGWMERRRDY